MTHRDFHSQGRQSGAVALPVSLAMAMILLLLVGIVHGNLLTEQRLSANQARSAEALAAAEAGGDWLLGRLNGGHALDARCQAVGGSAEPPFRDRHAGRADLAGRWTPGAATLSCMADGPSWACDCSGEPPLPHDARFASGTTFTVGLSPHPSGHLMQLDATGCSGGAACGAPVAPGSAQARVSLLVGHLPAVPVLPVAALTVHGTLDLGTSTWWVDHTDDSSGGIAVHTGGPIHAERLVTRAPPGRSAASARVADDPALRLDPRRAFAHRFRMDTEAWRTLPTVRRIDCTRACDHALRATLDAERPQLLWLAGGLHLDGPARIGSSSRPVVLVVDGPVSLGEAVEVHGVVYALSPEWRSSGGVEVHGAVVAAGSLRGHGVARVHHDALVLAALHRHAGTFVKVPGSWRDFQ